MRSKIGLSFTFATCASSNQWTWLPTQSGAKKYWFFGKSDTCCRYICGRPPSLLLGNAANDGSPLSHCQLQSLFLSLFVVGSTHPPKPPWNPNRITSIPRSSAGVDFRGSHRKVSIFTRENATGSGDRCTTTCAWRRPTPQAKMPALSIK